MIDHVLGRPSSRFRKYQVFTVVLFWSIYLLKGEKHGPPVIRQLSARLSKKLTLWQSVVITLLYLYIARNFAKITGLESPEPLANLYSRNFFRATWVTTGLDAGFWTAMKIKNKPLRDICSMIFTVYYLIAAEQADEKVRKVRATMTVEHIRTSWQKATASPYLAAAVSLMRPVKMRYGPRHLTINRPRNSTYKDPISAWMYFDGPLSELRKQTNVVINIPGGGFVAMSPRNHDDQLIRYAVDTKLPVLSLDYRKAPEFPYPYALNECFDAYQAIVSSYGQCLGLHGNACPRIALVGDSAGGNLATALVLMIISANNHGGYQSHDMIPLPAGIVLIYPSLDMNIGSWMSEDQMALIRSDRIIRRENTEFLRRKSEDLRRRYTPATTPKASQENFNPFDNDVKETSEKSSKPDDSDLRASRKAIEEGKPQRLRTRLAVSSMISYFGDRIITPEMMRAMIILYVGPYNRPDFKTDYLLSPAVAPDSLLSQFPKTYFMTGERDPLVDDTVIFAGRLRKAKEAIFNERKEFGLEKSSATFKEKQHVEVVLIPGISHGFTQFAQLFPDAWKHLHRCSGWIEQIFASKPTSFEAPGIAARQLKVNLPNLQSNSSALEMNGQRSAGVVSYSDEHEIVNSGATTPTTSGDEDAPLMMSSINDENVATSTGKQKDKLRLDRSKRRSTRARAGRDSPDRHERDIARPATAGSSTDPEADGGSTDNMKREAFYRLKNGGSRGKDSVGGDKTSQLSSEEDLLKRRMNELTMSIQGSDF